MSVSSISLQPSANSLNAAYRPVIITANASAPVVYCDIYFNNVFYKTLSLTQAPYKFDIQDAAQEYLNKYLAANGGTSIDIASPLFVSSFCKLRDSSLDANGFLVPEATIPIQATGSTGSTPGSGLQSNTFYIVNSTLQQDDNQSLAAHLASYKTGTWDSAVWPLTHRLDGYKVCSNDYFPVVSTGPTPTSLRVVYTNKDGTTGTSSGGGSTPACPVLAGVSIGVVDNGNGTQTFTFTWTVPASQVQYVAVNYRVNGSGGAYSQLTYTTGSGQVLTLPLGKYDFYFTTEGSCINTDTSVFSNYGIDAPVCVPVSIVGTPALTDANSGVDYAYSFTVAGTAPFSVDVSSYSGPASLTPFVTGNTISLTGQPTGSEEGTDIPVSFNITNACGTVPFSGTMNITPLARTLTFSQTGGFFQVLFNAEIDVNINIQSGTAEGKASFDCSGATIATTGIDNKNILAGNTQVSDSFNKLGDWSSVNSFTITGVQLVINGAPYILVFPGDVVTMGSYNVTIIFDGC